MDMLFAKGSKFDLVNIFNVTNMLKVMLMHQRLLKFYLNDEIKIEVSHTGDIKPINKVAKVLFANLDLLDLIYTIRASDEATGGYIITISSKEKEERIEELLLKLTSGVKFTTNESYISPKTILVKLDDCLKIESLRDNLVLIDYRKKSIFAIKEISLYVYEIK